MYACSTDSVSNLRHWCSVKLNKFIIEICTNKYMTSHCSLVWTTIIIPKMVKSSSQAKIMKHSSFPPRCDSLQNIEIALLTVPLVVICESVSRYLPTSWFSKLCFHFKNWIYSQGSYRFVHFSHC